MPEARSSSPLRLTGLILADIYLGEIKQWDAPAIKAENPGLTLKKRDIVRVCLPYASGSTAIFDDYSSKVRPPQRSHYHLSPWSSRPQCAISQNEAEAIELVRRTPGAIGYAELGSVLNQVLTAAIINRSGRSAGPSKETLKAAAENSMTNTPSDFRMWITDAPGVNSYPIDAYLYMLLYERQADRTAGAALIRFLTWVLHDGQKDAAQMNYGPLPKRLVQMEQKQLRKVQLPVVD